MFFSLSDFNFSLFTSFQKKCCFTKLSHMVFFEPHISSFQPPHILEGFCPHPKKKIRWLLTTQLPVAAANDKKGGASKKKKNTNRWQNHVLCIDSFLIISRWRLTPPPQGVASCYSRNWPSAWGFIPGHAVHLPGHPSHSPPRPPRASHCPLISVMTSVSDTFWKRSISWQNSLKSTSPLPSASPAGPRPGHRWG